MQNESKKVILQPIEKPLQKSEKVIKEKSKRVITKSSKWLFTEDDLKIENQHKILQKIINQEPEVDKDKNTKFLIQQIHQKIYGYRTQDLEKSIYMPTEFVDFSFVIHKLIETPSCFYCKEPVQLIYEFVREPKQWTLDRMDNSLGHNYGNVEIACLRCNLRRRIMHHERFVFTKQLVITKSGF